MQSFEAVLSLIFLVSILSLSLQLAMERPLDDSLYRMQLAEDSWRVLYLRGAFQDFGESKRAELEGDLALLGDETHLCYFIDGIGFTNCRGGSEDHEMTASLRKTVLYDGTPRSVTFSVGNRFRLPTYQHE